MQSEDQSGAPPDKAGKAALLLIDLINAMDFDGGDALLERTTAIVPSVLKLRDAADALGVPVIYVNDNGGHWHSERSRIVEACSTDDSPGREVARQLAPRPDDYFVIKPHLSGFYATSLPVLLPKLKASRIVLAGVAADICVLFTAADAHMRDYELWVPHDVVASEDDERTDWALDIMRKSMGAETRSAVELPLAEWLARDGTHAS